ncbi:MAG: FkbM family methyltransferase [Verrucomicrobiota bacterium]
MNVATQPRVAGSPATISRKCHCGPARLDLSAKNNCAYLTLRARWESDQENMWRGSRLAGWTPVSLKLFFKKCERRVRSYRRHLFELCGQDRYSKPARHELDAKLGEYLPAKGFFVEAGAMDGFIASNTYYLERIKGWRGILVEPIPEYFHECVRQRPGSQVLQCALVAPDFAPKTVTMNFSESMSFVKDVGENEEVPSPQGLAGTPRQYSVTVPARTMTSILSEWNAPTVDFLSLDVEGYELEVLRGLDLALHKPVFVLVECLTAPALAAVRQQLEPHYDLVATLTHRDFLFRAR